MTEDRARGADAGEDAAGIDAAVRRGAFREAALSDKRIFNLVHEHARRNAISEVARAPDGYRVTVAPPTRSLDQNAKFHAICSDMANAGAEWAGKRRNAAEWKFLLVSGHAVATNERAEIVPGLEGEFVNIRESTASMSKRRGASLIEYALAFCAMRGIEIAEEATA